MRRRPHSTYSVCKVNSVTPEVTFKRIIEQYKQLAGAGGGGLSGGVGTPRLSVVKDILLRRGGHDEEAGHEGVGEPLQEKRGDIIKFYNKVGNGVDLKSSEAAVIACHPVRSR